MERPGFILVHSDFGSPIRIAIAAIVFYERGYIEGSNIYINYDITMEHPVGVRETPEQLDAILGGVRRHIPPPDGGAPEQERIEGVGQ